MTELNLSVCITSLRVVPFSLCFFLLSFLSCTPQTFFLLSSLVCVYFIYIIYLPFFSPSFLTLRQRTSVNLCRFDAASRRVRRHNDCLESSVSWWIDNDSRSSQLSGEVISYRVCEICIECSHSCRGCLSPLCIRLCSSTAMDYIRIARHQIPLQHQPP